MTTAAPSTALATIQPAFTDPERLALAGFLAGFRGLTRDAYALDLRQFTTSRQAGCGRRPVADHVVTAGVVPGAPRHCLRGAGLRSGGGRGRGIRVSWCWPVHRDGQRVGVLAGAGGCRGQRAVVPGRAAAPAGLRGSRWRGGLSAACAPALSGVSAQYCERNEAEEVSRPAMAIHPPTSSPKLAVLVPAAATWSGPRRCARFR